MQCCGKLLSDLFETYKTFQRTLNPEFERKFDVYKTPDLEADTLSELAFYLNF